ncbi:hypothetical protein A6M27_02845 [Acidithiobacillus thiooxidans]|uniref:Uncharacterized protein n=1 Tax=Acidithiobacillus thiooxidans TaxID=930 RepID=A0A1C2IPL9_ACITH|nr:hypothetical protein [Acidithiobacillus thiooxidans]OCX76242.1 hypothetical protein A6P07_02805 [Acidithiobacillus thiooxidans]OCX77953.1 hypothetical protein A6O24_05680 [Acidithiobacillus thiooxidans]OCX84908.1 hypothetical protein A6O26_02885 [Acidithiobacillus thiooxidans]OCX89287.1 hypothetical protein A6M27_02845 [Acidithiobacillus thiooxidans]OFC49103.1 hypothetical protein BAE47_05990 [Acidithiobacillus thiooxidans]
MISQMDIENLVKAEQTVDLLMQDIQAVASSESALLSNFAVDLTLRVAGLKLHIKRLHRAAKAEAD